MKVNRKSNGRAMSMPVGAAYGAIVALMWTLITSGVLAWLINGQILQEEAIGYGSMVILLTASILGALLANGKVKRQRLVTCACTGIIYFLTLMALTAMFFGGQYNGIGVTALLILGGSGTAAILSMRKRKSQTGRVHKIRV